MVMKFTIITVCLNSSNTIEKTINSVLSQKYNNIEYIIIDGGSIDGTVDIIKKFSKKIDYWSSEPDGGIYDAMNKGISKATGDVISFLNSNDWYENGIFEIIDKVFKENLCDMVCGRVNFIQNGQIIGQTAHTVSSKDFYIGMIYPHSAMFSKKEVFKKYGLFNTTYKICADYDWLLRVYNENIKIQFIDYIFSNFALGGISGSSETAEETKEICLKNLPHELYEKYYDKILERYILNKSYFVCNEVSAKLNCKKINGEQYVKLLQKFNVKNQCNIFGVGIKAYDCLNFLNSLNIYVINIYDNDINKQGKLFEGLVIKSKDEIDISIPTVITSYHYEREIEKEFIKENINNYILFSDLAKEVMQIYNCEY